MLNSKAVQAIKNRRSIIKDSDPRGYKVNDQIIKGFMIYKSGKPNMFTAKNESGEQYEGTMEEIKAKIDAYWVKRDEDVMKQKVNDTTTKTINVNGAEVKVAVDVSPRWGIIYRIWGISNVPNSMFNSQEGWNNESQLIDEVKKIQKKMYGDSKTKDGDLKEKLIRLAEQAGDKQYADDIRAGKVPSSQSELIRRINWYETNINDSKTKDKSPRWRIKDDKMFKLKTAAKKMKDAASPALFDNDFEGWKAKAEGLGYEVKENKTTGLWEAKAGIAIKGTYNKTKGGRLYLDSKANDDIMYQGQLYPAKELHGMLASKGKVKEFSQLSEKEQKERMDNPYALYESGDNIYAVVRRNKIN